MIRESWLGRVRVRILVATMRAASRFPRVVRVAGLRLRVPAGVCPPVLLPGLSFASLFQESLKALPRGARVLDVGTGCGLLALLAARGGGTVTATDLPGVPLGVVEENARRNGLPSPRLLTGNLFAPVAGERFDLVLFNPPFHFGRPRDERDRSYFGGAEGEVVRRFLEDLPEHLRPGGAALMALPARERRQYEAPLARYRIRAAIGPTLPLLLGRVEMLSLSPMERIPVETAPRNRYTAVQF